MGVTFMLPVEFRRVTREEHRRVNALPCPKCKGHWNGAEPDYDCSACVGYGGDIAARNALYEREGREDGEFNVANGNAGYITQELLNLGHDSIYGGSIAPQTVLMRLAAVFDTSNGVVEPSESQAVRLDANGVGLGCVSINCGRSQRQIDSYLSRLRRLAEIAIERGAPEIVWG